MSKKTPAKLPNELVILPNKDKKFHEKWGPNRNILNFPHPFRGVLLGPPNSGKSNVIKNVLIRAKPPFKKVYVIHCDAGHTKEYDDLGAVMMSDIPAPEEWDGAVKSLVIIDDIELKLLNKDGRRHLDRLFGYVSTHKNISCLLTSQCPFNVPPIVRRCSNIFVLWKGPDLDSMANIARKVGLKVDDLKTMFNELCKNKHDSIWIDLTSNTAAPLRLNGFEIITKKDDSSSDSEHD